MGGEDGVSPVIDSKWGNTNAKVATATPVRACGTKGSWMAPEAELGVVATSSTLLGSKD